MKRNICIILIMVLMASFSILPAAAQDNVLSWEAKNADAYANGADSGNDWYFYDSGWAEYTVDILQNGIYELRITKHNLVGDSVFTVTADGSKVFGAWNSGEEKENVLVSDQIYFNSGARKLKFQTSKGGIVSGFELILKREETQIYKGVKDWTEQPSGGDNGDRWYFYDNTAASYEFDIPENGKYKVLLNYQGTPVNAKSLVTYNNYKYECTPGTSSDIKTKREIIRDITLMQGKAVLTISGLGSCNVSGITLVLEKKLDTVSPIYADNISFWDESGNRCENIAGKEMARINADIINHTEMPVTVMMFYAKYNRAGDLTEIKTDTQTAAANGGARLNIRLSDSVEAQRGDTYKVFIWQDNDKPIADNIEYRVPNNDIYVSTDGSDEGTGTRFSPYKTPKRAQQEVRTLNQNMTEDINVYFEKGCYYADDTLRFDEADSGSNGYRVNWLSLGGDVSFSGADVVSGWEKYNDKIYCAAYKTDKPVRQMSVNGTSAVRAKSREMVAINGMTAEGVTIDDIKYADYHNQSDIQLHFSSGWKSYLMNVENIEAEENASKFTVSESAMNTANSKVQHHMYPNHHVWIENAFEELDEAGEFYYDRTDGIIYYIPREGENMETAQVHIPVLETLIDLRGSDAYHKVKNISFSGFTFENVTWYQPAEYGLLNDQAQMIVADGTVTERSRYGAMVSTAGIMMNFAENITFENNLIRDMGAVGIGLYEGVYDCNFSQNTFCDIADSAMTVGTLYQVCEDIEYQGKNLVGNKKTKSNAGTNAYAEHAIDCNTNSLWSPPDGACWWQIDLDEPYEIDRIEIDSRTDNGKTGLQGDLKGVRILASDTEDFSTYTQIGVISDDTETKGNTYILPISDSTPYRYVRFAKNSYTCLANVRIINESMEYAPIVQTCKNNTIDNNYISRIGLVNYGAPGIQAYYTSGLSVMNNEIEDVPYSGICVGWGWNQNKTSKTCHDNLIFGNKITNCMQTCFDGGGIYTLGQQPGTVISGNNIVGQANHLAAIYLDSGTAGITVKDNVLDDVPLSVFVTGDTNDCTVQNNYTTSVKNTNGSSNKDSIQYTEPEIFVPGAMTENAKTIADNSGIRANAEAIRQRVQLIPNNKNYIFQNAMDNRESIGYMNDAYFAQYWLGIYLDSADKWIELSEGRLSQDFLDECSSKLSALRTEMKDSISDRQKIVSLYWQYKEVADTIREQY